MTTADTQRATYARRRAAGLCTRCEAPAPEGPRCADCRADDLAARERIYAERRAAGLCVACGARSKAYARCLQCRRRGSARKAARRAP